MYSYTISGKTYYQGEFIKEVIINHVCDEPLADKKIVEIFRHKALTDWKKFNNGNFLYFNVSVDVISILIVTRLRSDTIEEQ